jgi:hypothetical protein
MPTEAQYKAATQDELKTLIERRHPSYDASLEHWRFLEATYEGGRAWFKDNIFRYHKEGVKEYRDRVKRAYRPNHTREVVDIVNKYVFKGDITRASDAEKEVQAFWKSATLDKRPIPDLMEAASRRASIFGRIWFIVDNNQPADAISMADQKNSKSRVYAYTVKPENALDWDYSDNGDLAWLKVRETRRDASDPLTSSGATRTYYRIWGTTYWVLIREDVERDKFVYTVEEYREHNLGVVPAFSHEHVYADDRDDHPALIADSAYLDRAVANYLSNLDAIIQDQTFSQLVIPAQSMLPGDDQYKQLVEMGTKRVFAYDGEGGAGPEFISPDPRQASLIIAVVEKIISEIYHSVGMAGERTKQDNSQGIDNSSGVAKSMDFEKLNSLLASKARGIQLAEHNLVRLVLAWNGKVEDLQDTPEHVHYPASFDTRSFATELDTAMKMKLLEAPETVRKEQMQVMVDKLWPNLKRELREKMRAEIENDWPADPMEMLIATAALTKPKLGDAAGTDGPPVKGKPNRQGERPKEA